MRHRSAFDPSPPEDAIAATRRHARSNSLWRGWRAHAAGGPRWVRERAEQLIAQVREDGLRSGVRAALTTPLSASVRDAPCHGRAYVKASARMWGNALLPELADEGGGYRAVGAFNWDECLYVSVTLLQGSIVATAAGEPDTSDFTDEERRKFN